MSDEDKALISALDLARRLPPSQLDSSLDFICQLNPDLTEDLLEKVDVPLKVKKCKTTGKDFLICEYNRDGDSYRSPWSNKYEPELEDGVTPPDDIRKMEIAANAVFSSYCNAYYEGSGLSSVYMWDDESGGFGACVLLRKDGSGLRGVTKGVWDSIHVVGVQVLDKNRARYQLTTTIILSLATQQNNLDLSGYIQRQDSKELRYDKYQTHIANIGEMIQTMENKLYDVLEKVYFGKAKEITSALRSPYKQSDRKIQSMLVSELANALSNKKR